MWDTIFIQLRAIHKSCIHILLSSLSVRPSSLTLSSLQTDEDPKEIDFFTKQARLQIEARMALAQAKDMAHMQMEVSAQNEFIFEEIRKYKFSFVLLSRWNGRSKKSRQSQISYAVRSKRSASIFRRRSAVCPVKCLPI